MKDLELLLLCVYGASFRMLDGGSGEARRGEGESDQRPRRGESERGDKTDSRQ
jgi:hypothetical protein